MEKICCGLCGFKFNTHTVIEQHYVDYELEDVERVYPIKTDGRSPILMRNYICSECLKNLDSVLLEQLIIKGEDFLNAADRRFEKVRKKYESEIEELKQRDEHIQNCLNAIRKSKSVLAFSDSFVHELEANDDVFHPYYLRRGIDYLNEHKKYRVSELSKKYGISFLEILSPYGMESLVTLKEFKRIVENSVSDVPFNKLRSIIIQLEKDI